jgi:hypothetical protein
MNRFSYLGNTYPETIQSEQVVVRMIAGAAAAQMVKERMEGQTQVAERKPAAAERTSNPPAAPARVRLRAASALRAAADRLAPAREDTWRSRALRPGQME